MARKSRPPSTHTPSAPARDPAPPPAPLRSAAASPEEGRSSDGLVASEDSTTVGSSSGSSSNSYGPAEPAGRVAAAHLPVPSSLGQQLPRAGHGQAAIAAAASAAGKLTGPLAGPFLVQPVPLRPMPLHRKIEGFKSFERMRGLRGNGDGLPQLIQGEDCQNRGEAAHQVLDSLPQRTLTHCSSTPGDIKKLIWNSFPLKGSRKDN